METKNCHFAGIIRRIFVALILLFLCSTPIFYLIIAKTDKISLYITVRSLRLLLAILIGYKIRRENLGIYSNNEPQRKKSASLTLGIICISILLHLVGITPRLYLTISHTIGIYGLRSIPLFLAILWEQLFSGDLYWSILLCLAMVFLKYPNIARKKLYSKG